MKRVVIILFSAALAVSGLFAYSMKWARYDLIDEGNDITRGVAYSPDSDHVYVPTRLNDNPCVVILDAETGVTLDTLQRPEGGYSGGVYPLNLCVVDDDGAIYVGNLSVPAIIATDVFKVYKYETEESDPVVVFENALGGMRFGDSFAAVGSGENVHLYASGMGNDKIADLVVSGDTLALNKMINLPASGAARHGISPIEPGGDLWINGTDASTFPVNLIDSNGNLKATIPDTLIASGSSTVHHWRAGSINVVSVVNPFMSNTLKSIRYDVFSDGLGDSYTFDYLGKNSDSLLFAHNGTILNNNINGSAVLDYDTTRHVMYVAMGVNCVAAIHLDSLMQVSTPRDGGYFAMQIDGKKKEYTRYDKVAVDGDREFYATWGSQMMYLGITGNTLYAPYQDHQLYAAFDLDPDGSSGSTIPPTDAGGLSSLPFNADVVIRFDSDTSPLIDLSSDDPARKWTGGFVYKYNGSVWSESVISGFDVNYGALCVVGDRNDSLITEIGIARTAEGIGTDTTAVKFMVYVVENGSDGDLLASFPANTVPSMTACYSVNGLTDGKLARRDILGMDGEGVGTEAILPVTCSLSQNYPNPFNPMTKIDFSLPQAGDVNISVYDLSGRRIKTLVNSRIEAGQYNILMDGSRLASGMYIYNLTLNNETIAARKMLLMK